MRVVVALEARLIRTPDGQVWGRGWVNYPFWQRYLEVFDEVGVVARLRDAAEPPPGAQPIEGPGVRVHPIPYYVGPYEYVFRSLSVRRAIRAALQPADAAILRAPGMMSTRLHAVLRAVGQPYAVEVLGDPRDVFRAGAVRTSWRPLLRWWYARGLRRQCAEAAAVAYITDHVLQEGYPPAPGAHAVACSDIDLPDEAFARGVRLPQPEQRAFHLLLVGSLQQLYKGPDVLLRALAVNVGRGLDLRLTILGEGRHRPEMERLALQLGLGDRVRFAGLLPAGDPVRALMDDSDLFVLPSRAEGQGRALLEAMARGLPCVASAVGGIPELLAPEDLVPPANVEALAEKIRAVLHSRQRLAQMAARNLKRAADFHAYVLRARRRAFYEVVRDRTLQWQRRASGCTVAATARSPRDPTADGDEY
jgi:glycosyltransferase involved in cell wall biosynthesis